MIGVLGVHHLLDGSLGACPVLGGDAPEARPEPGDGRGVLMEGQVVAARGVRDRLPPENDERDVRIACRKVVRDDLHPICDAVEGSGELLVRAIRAQQDRVGDVEDEHDVRSVESGRAGDDGRAGDCGDERAYEQREDGGPFPRSLRSHNVQPIRPRARLR